MIEAIVAIAVFALLAATMASLLLGGLNPWLNSRQDLTGEILADEGLEAARAIGQRAWNELRWPVSGLSRSGGEWHLAGDNASETIGDYERQITIDPVCRDFNHQLAACPAVTTDWQTRLVGVTVNWQTALGVTRQVKRQVYLSNWQSFNWQQNDWSGGDGQSVWLDPAKYDSGQNVDTGQGGVRLTQNEDGTYQTEGELISSAFNTVGRRHAQLITWSGLTTGQSAITWQVRAAANDNGAPGTWSAWFGESGANTYFTKPGLISPDLNGYDWLQYRLHLTGDGGDTPVVSQIILNYK